MKGCFLPFTRRHGGLCALPALLRNSSRSRAGAGQHGTAAVYFINMALINSVWNSLKSALEMHQNLKRDWTTSRELCGQRNNVGCRTNWGCGGVSLRVTTPSSYTGHIYARSYWVTPLRFWGGSSNGHRSPPDRFLMLAKLLCHMTGS